MEDSMIDPTAELQHEIRDAAHTLAGIIGFAMTVDGKLPKREKLWGKVLLLRLRVLHAQFNRDPSERIAALEAELAEASHVLSVTLGWRATRDGGGESGD